MALCECSGLLSIFDAYANRKWINEINLFSCCIAYSPGLRIYNFQILTLGYITLTEHNDFLKEFGGNRYYLLLYS